MQEEYMFDQEGEHPFDFFDSPCFQPAFNPKDSLRDHLEENINDQDMPPFYPQQDLTKKNPKLQKNRKIRTSRNVQKVYHNILRNWLEKHKYSSILPKYNAYYNQRVYFILVLDQILKQSNGQEFYIAYKQMANEVIYKKNKEIEQLQKIKHCSEQSQHLKRVIEEIEFSLKACKLYVQGNTLEALIVVYKRNQDRIVKLKEFDRALRIYEDVTSHNPQQY